MKNIIAYIETGEDKTYNVYINEELPFGFFGEGKTVEEAKEDFLQAFEEMKELHLKRTGVLVEYSFIFKYDIASFFSHFCKIFSMPALERMTGINQKQLHHYAMGKSKPRNNQKQKIEKALHQLGEELTAINL